MRNGVTFLKKPSSYILLRSKSVSNFANNFVLILNENNIKSDATSVTSALIFLLLFLGIVASIIFTSPIAGLAIILCFVVCLISYVKASLDKRMTNLRNSIPDMLRSMSVCFGAGYTIYQTFSQISIETRGLLKKLFRRSTQILQTGGSVSEALYFLKNSESGEELSFLAVALDVQHQTGGSMKPVIDSARDMVENKLELMRLLHVQTAQAKLSARIVMILPFALIAIFSIVSPGFLLPFFSSFLGIVLLLIACIMQFAGFILVKKILNINI